MNIKFRGCSAMSIAPLIKLSIYAEGMMYYKSGPCTTSNCKTSRFNTGISHRRAIAAMDSEWKTSSTLSEAHPETMDFLSNAWCDFAIQALQPEPELQDRSIILLNDPITKLEPLDLKAAITKTDTSMKMDSGNMKSSLPSWKSNDVQSWIWMQQAMHPELNYNRKKWLDWKILPFKGMSIKKWLKEMKLKRKEEGRLKKAEVHAALSIAGLAASVAAIAAESSSNQYESNNSATKDAAVASAAALVAAHCAKMAEIMGADKGQLRSVIGSAMSGTGASDVLTLTSAAATSLRGVEALQARTGCISRLNGAPPPLPIDQDSNVHDVEFNFDECRILLAKGAQLYVETSSGKFALRLVSILLRSDAKVILKTRRPNFLNAFERGKEGIILDVHTELYKDTEMTERETEITCYLVVLTTTTGTVKLDMSDDYALYKSWTMTINHMLKASTSCTKYDLEFYKI